MDNDMMENNISSISEELEVNEGVTSSKTELERIVKQLDTLEVLNHAMWLLLSEKGFTHDELNNKITQILDDKKNMSNAKIDMKCKVCNQKMQVSGKFLAKCIYCGTENSFNPYQLEVNKPVDATEETLEIHHVPEETFEPYDVNKDLNFDSEM